MAFSFMLSQTAKLELNEKVICIFNGDLVLRGLWDAFRETVQKDGSLFKRLSAEFQTTNHHFNDITVYFGSISIVYVIQFY